MFCNFLAGLFPLRLPLSRSNSTTRLLGDHILEVVLLVGDAVHVQVGGDHVAVEDEGQLADAALVKDLLDDVVVGLVELLLILSDHHVMAFLRVLSHPGQGERLPTQLAGGLAIVNRVVAEPEPLQVLRVLFHVLRKRGLGVHVVIAHIAMSRPHSPERCVLWPCGLSTNTQRKLNERT